MLLCDGENVSTILQAASCVHTEISQDCSARRHDSTCSDWYPNINTSQRSAWLTVVHSRHRFMYNNHPISMGLLDKRHFRRKDPFENTCKSKRHLSATCFEYFAAWKFQWGRMCLESSERWNLDCMWSCQWIKFNQHCEMAPVSFGHYFQHCAALINMFVFGKGNND